MSGAEVISVFQSLGFEVVSTRGSHAKLRRFAGDAKQTLTVPTHSELDTGTLRAIIRHATAYIPESELVPYFWAR
jgi:predicted RNA binding protein YcfA (HicA-like mRNA interferase family)